MSQIIVGFATEGSTDKRLLESIIQRTFEEIAFECNRQIEVVSPIIKIGKPVGDNFQDRVYQSAIDAYDNGVMAFCIHVDADSESDEKVFTGRIQPSFDFVESQELQTICKNLVAMVPIQMSESWMLADKQLLKDEIGTNKSDVDLGLTRTPQSIANPKDVIENAIRVVREDLPKKRRRDLTISELYQPIGQKIQLEKLETIPSYMKFKEAVRNAYRRLNYLQ